MADNTDFDYGILICKFGPLGHGPIKDVENELIKYSDVARDMEAQGKEHNLHIVRYNFITHDIAPGGVVVERPKPLKAYTPAELYAMTPKFVENDVRDWLKCFSKHLPIYFENTTSNIEVRIIYDSPDFGLATLWFDNKPFMISQVGGGTYRDERGGGDFITDVETYWKAIEHLWKLNRSRSEEEMKIISANERSYRLTLINDNSIDLE